MHYNPHPLSDIFPILAKSDLQELANDITANGLRSPIILHENQILDGRNRFHACGLAGITPRFELFKGGDALAFVISSNLHRRHLSTKQRAEIAAKLSNMRQGNPNCFTAKASNEADKNAPLLVSEKQAAKLMNVSRASVQRAKAESRPAVPKSGPKPEPAKLTDAFGHPVPADIGGEWERAEVLANTLRAHCQAVKIAIEKGLAPDAKDPIFAELSQADITEAKGLHFRVTCLKPHSLCPTCGGEPKEDRKKCAVCKRRGFISKTLYQSPIMSEEARKGWERNKK